MRRLFALLLLSLGLIPAAFATSRLPALPDSLRTALRAASTHRARAGVLLRAIAYFDTPDPDSAAMLGYAAAAMQAARAAGDSVLVGRALDAGSNYYLTVQNFERAAVLERRAEELLREAPVLYRARNAWNLGWVYVNLRRPDLARRYYRLASNFFSAAGDADGQAGVWQELGQLYQNLGRHDSAVTAMFKAVSIYRNLKEVRQEAKALSNVASVFAERGQPAVSSRYCRQVYRLAASIADSALMAVGLEGLGVNAQRVDSPAVALNYLRRQQALVRHLRFYSNRTGLYENLAAAYRRLQRPDSAAFYYQAAISLAQRTHDPDRVLGNMYTNLASFYQEQREPDQAEAWASKALALAGGRPSEGYTTDALALLQKLAIARHDYPAAYALQRREMQARDTLQAQADKRVLEEARASYEVAQAEQEVVMLRQEQELARLRRQRELAGAGGLLALALGAGGVGLAQYRRRARHREAALRTRLAADLHDDVGSLLTQISLESSWLQTSRRTPEQLATHLQHLSEASRRAVQQLSDVVWGIDARNDATSPLLERMRDHAHEVLSVANLEVDFAADASLAGAALPGLLRQNLYLIYKEALHNVVKHARATLVTVRLQLQDGYLSLRVQDDGQGYDGPGRVGGQGLTNMQARALACGGSVLFERGLPGLAVVVRLPV
ncbi:tetratricopeptide repeat-containing sensor histidine kinase [Hymenobacter guriensis]|uniref:Tetratricopeptide repeat protein n=1 Tax=Hymenobacter guriensis TaxID=2793065 RepID=A0ABS0KWI5_9BACT|nr:tetratricopeptide repeat protein [Hymenobacter guriensis]MBG8552198.1 tetratricopeptide repeat protein [Hymenobacter guriensis]